MQRAPPIGQQVSERHALRLRNSALTSIAGNTGRPQISLPVAEVDGHPVGLSLLGDRGDDEILIALAQEIAESLSMLGSFQAQEGATRMEGIVALISGVGSQYALPVATPTASSTCGRQLVAIDYSEEALKANPIPPRAILPSGSAGGGLSQQLLTSVEHCLANPMIEGVSSLNPATGLAVNLRTWRLEQ